MHVKCSFAVDIARVSSRLVILVPGSINPWRMEILLAFAFLILLFIFSVSIYNKLVKARIHVDEGWSGIDVQLKRRADLILNLVNTVKGYASHEAKLLNEITELRARSIADNSVAEQSQVEGQLGTALRSLLVVVENYPDLKANQNFVSLQTQLEKIEHDLQLARRYYNGTVRDNNILIDAFPSNILAILFSFGKREFFEIEDTLRDSVPEVKFPG